MTWRELITGLTSEAEFGGPTAEASLGTAEQTLNQPLPPKLAELLLEAGGVTGEYGIDLIWPLDRIVADNLHFRASAEFVSLYMPFHPLLFFADAGNGDQFALLSSPVDRPDVFVWDHETDSRTWIAGNLEDYLRRSLTGALDL